MKAILCVLAASIIFSCKPVSQSIITQVYGINKDMDFHSKAAYLDYVKKKYAIDLDNFYVIDSGSYFDFMARVVAQKTDYYFGTFLNDTTEIIKSTFLLQHQSCLSRVMAEIKAIDESGNPKTKTANSLHSYRFSNAVSNQPLSFAPDETKKIVLVFSYKAGRVTADDFAKIQRLIEGDNRYRLYIISIDTEAVSNS